MNANNNGYFNERHLDIDEVETDEIRLLKAQIDEMRLWGCNNFANLLCDELKELRAKK